uniref:Uncharacterized protein n=1 Tax=Sphaerodactylus townsendi TaxID=933632 RepID=A0ACB8FIW6_9SAUR
MTPGKKLPTTMKVFFGDAGFQGALKILTVFGNSGTLTRHLLRTAPMLISLHFLSSEMNTIQLPMTQQLLPPTPFDTEVASPDRQGSRQLLWTQQSWPGSLAVIWCDPVLPAAVGDAWRG